MTYDALTKFLLSLPGAELSIKWGSDHIFVVGGKMFAGMGPKKTHEGISFKADEMSFEILTRKRGIAPAKYLARAKWVSLDTLGRLPDAQLKAYLVRAHALVAAGLPKKTRLALGIADPPHEV
ncbi:MAG TPA: MmcQ/YjbR family DNA-binding protein [Rhizomicrobium sp.]|jgi:predicted DNA-binding protein (MmcQ/YjbR family)|nr:MmcQ/YjbR family DNA-binding protein [Rhizomicrobium sp.]